MKNQKLKIKEDARGRLIEIFKFPKLGQVFYSTTKPGLVRGNHYHLRKKEFFCLIEGKAKITLRNRETDEVEEHFVSDDRPEIVEIKIGWTHNIKNIGDQEIKLLIWVNEVFNPQDPDTYAEEV